MAVGPQHVAYLERAFLSSRGEWSADIVTPSGSGSLEAPELFRIHRISLPSDDPEASRRWSREAMATFLAGLSAGADRFVFLVLGGRRELSFFLGRESRGGDKVRPEDTRGSLDAALWAAFPGLQARDRVEQSGTVADRIRRLPHGRAIVGTPHLDPLDVAPRDRLERVARGLYGSEWAYGVVATPTAEADRDSLRETVLNEQRMVLSEEQSAGGPSPLTQSYLGALDSLREKLDQGSRLGLWNASAYLLAEDSSTLDRGVSLLRSALAGETSLPDGIRSVAFDGLNESAAALAPVTAPGPPGPGLFTYPYATQSLVHSGELAMYAHLPVEEMPGFATTLRARFDVALDHAGSRAEGSGDGDVFIGTVQDEGRSTGNELSVSPSSLTRHTLVAGSTGSGKTNTIFHLLDQLASRGVPFLVVEPAKTEYRALLDRTESAPMHLFTLGNENLSPFRLNPLEVLPGVAVQTHIDHVKAAFNAAFAMFAPLPHVLERCLYRVYRDLGWDLTTGRMSEGSEPAFPTLSDLVEQVDPVVSELGYGSRITGDIRGALKTRLGSLCLGAKGRMLDVEKGVPIGELLKVPTILEMEALGDDEEKAFVIGLLLMFLYEHRVAEGHEEGGPIRHVTVFEEAHRLLRDVPMTTDSETANTQGQAVETFNNILSEVRAYGEGLVIADQIPSKLSPDVVKNTALRIVHRLGGYEDRTQLGEVMNCSHAQIQRISYLSAGTAAVHAEGMDRPVLVRVPYRKAVRGEEKHTREDVEERIRATMAEVPWVRRRGRNRAARHLPSGPDSRCGEPGCSHCARLHPLATSTEVGDRIRSLVQEGNTGGAWARACDVAWKAVNGGSAAVAERGARQAATLCLIEQALFGDVELSAARHERMRAALHRWLATEGSVE